VRVFGQCLVLGLAAAQGRCRPAHFAVAHVEEDLHPGVGKQLIGQRRAERADIGQGLRPDHGRDACVLCTCKHRLEMQRAVGCY
jgi:hypothetical protein